MVYHSDYLTVNPAWDSLGRADVMGISPRPHICIEKKKEKRCRDKASQRCKEGAYRKSYKPIGHCQRDKIHGTFHSLTK